MDGALGPIFIPYFVVALLFFVRAFDGEVLASVLDLYPFLVVDLEGLTWLEVLFLRILRLQVVGLGFRPTVANDLFLDSYQVPVVLLRLDQRADQEKGQVQFYHGRLLVRVRP
jgi:hypothetical protein